MNYECEVIIVKYTLIICGQIRQKKINIINKFTI